MQRINPGTVPYFKFFARPTVPILSWSAGVMRCNAVLLLQVLPRCGHHRATSQEQHALGCGPWGLDLLYAPHVWQEHRNTARQIWSPHSRWTHSFSVGKRIRHQYWKDARRYEFSNNLFCCFVLYFFFFCRSDRLVGPSRTPESTVLEELGLRPRFLTATRLSSSVTSSLHLFPAHADFRLPSVSPKTLPE